MPDYMEVNEATVNQLFVSAGVTPEPDRPPQLQTVSSSSGRGEFDLESFLRTHLNARPGEPYDGGTKYVLPCCPFNEDHKAPDAAIIQLAGGAIVFKCLHNSCSGKTWRDVRAMFEPGCYDKPAQKERTRLQPAADSNVSLTPFATMSCGELEESPEEEFLCKGVIVARQPNMIGGPPKAFKTTIAVDLALSMATGGYFLGYFKCPRPVSVLFMSAESGLSTLRKTAASVCKEAGIDWPNVPNLRWSTLLPKFGVDEELQRLDMTFAENPFDCLIVDPLYKAMPSADAGNVFAAGELFAHFGRWADANEVTLVLLHHLKKGVSNPHEPADLQDFAWSGFAEHARSWLLLSRREKYVPPADHKLWMSIGGSAGHGGCWGLDINQGEFIEGQPREWNIKLTPAAELLQGEVKAKQQAKVAEKEQVAKAKIEAGLHAIVKALRDQRDGQSKTWIRTQAGLNSDQLAASLAEGLKCKSIMPCDVFKSGKKTPIEGYRLAEYEAKATEEETL